MAISCTDLLEHLDRYPRIPLAEYPTRLEALPNLSSRVGRRLYIKRDDQIGPGLGGNKTRKLEYLLADARACGFRKVVTFGGLQSNHARLTAAAAVKLGLEPHLFYFDQRPARLTGNLLVNRLLGAHLHFIPFGGNSRASMTLEETVRLVRLVAFARVGRNYFIPVGGHTWLGCLGYVRAAVEIEQQAAQMGLENAWVVTAAGTGGTLAGLAAGLALTGSRIKPLGIDVGRLWKKFPASIGRLSEEICTRLEEAQAFPAAQVPLVEDRYVGAGYALPSQPCRQAQQTLARTEGILLDPVYTGKAFGGMLDLVARGELGQPDEPVIFLHTGGAPALFM